MLSMVNGSIVAADGRVLVGQVKVRGETITLEGTREFDLFINDTRVHLVRETVDETDTASGLPITLLEKDPKAAHVEFRAKDARHITTITASVIVEGNVTGHVSTASGNVTVRQKVQQGVNTMSGDITVEGSVEGSATTMSGDIQAAHIQGSSSTMTGTIHHNPRKRHQSQR